MEQNELTLRNGDLGRLVEMLKNQQTRKHDVVMPASRLRAEVIDGATRLMVPDHALTIDGVTTVTVPNEIGSYAAGSIATKTDIPVRYVRKMMDVAPELAATNFNHWFAADDRDVLVRTFNGGPDGGMGFTRAILSDKFAMNLENVDAIMATLDGIRAAGVSVVVRGADITERSMHVRLYSPEISVNVEDLVGKYTHNGNQGHKYPLLFAGLSLKNSEVGAGAWQLAPTVVFEVCTNGMTRTSEAVRRVHVGSRMEEGVVDWSVDTNRKTLDLISAQTRDAVKAIMNHEYLGKVVDDLRSKANIKVTKPIETVKIVCAQLKYSEAEQDALLAMFVEGGDLTALGMGQAVTALAQNAVDGDAQADAEANVWGVMDVTAKAVMSLA